MYVTDYRDGNITRRQPLKSLRDESIVALSKRKYTDMVKEGQLRSAYEENEWKLFQEGHGEKSVRFNLEEKKIRKKLADKGYEQFINDLKTLVLLRHGKCSLKILARAVRYIQLEMAYSGFETGCCRPESTDHGQLIRYLISFLKTTDWGTKEYLEESAMVFASICAENAAKRGENSHPVLLNEFMSYFEFERILNKSWKHTMTDIQREYYYPLELYWKVTTVLPMRVMEFCVTPYDCLAVRDGRFYMTIRRTHLKGNTRDEKIHFYRIDKDYTKYEYEIPKWLYDLVDGYRKASKDFHHPYDLLFSIEYFSSLKYKKRFARSEDATFDVRRLNSLLNEFYAEFVIEQEDMTIVTESELLERYFDEEDGSYKMYPGEIMMMQLRHTRHLAMINIIRWGCNPMLIKSFAGHTSAAEDAHYYANTGKFVRCATKIAFERAKGPAADKVIDELMTIDNNMQVFNMGKTGVQVDGGVCHSSAFARGDYSGCLKCDGKCRVCRHYSPDKKEDKLQEDEEKINEAGLYLVKMLRSETIEARIDEFQQKALRLTENTANYASKLWQAMEWETEKEPIYV